MLRAIERDHPAVIVTMPGQLFLPQRLAKFFRVDACRIRHVDRGY